MNGKKYSIIFICSFIAAGLVCVIAGLVTYLAGINSSSSGIVGLIGIIILAVGCADTFVSAAVLAFYLLFIRRKTGGDEEKDKLHQEDKKD
ncbi:MAG: hypothetical protein LUI60_08170 [Clostridia bacterium]|nr:hypothetical protein [Clostridia bacterium]